MFDVIFDLKGNGSIFEFIEALWAWKLFYLFISFSSMIYFYPGGTSLSLNYYCFSEEGFLFSLSFKNKINWLKSVLH